MGKDINVNGRNISIPADRASGAEIKKVAGIDPARMLTVWRPEGVKAVPDSERFEVQPGDYFEDVPNWQYGEGALAGALRQ